MIESQSEEGGEEEQVAEGTSPGRLPRARTLMTPVQLEGLQTLWEETRFPSTVARERLGERISLTSRKVQVWFQNQRSKHRRMESERLNPIQPSFSQHNHLSNPTSSFNTAYDARVQQPPPPPSIPSSSHQRDWNRNPSPPSASSSSSHHHHHHNSSFPAPPPPPPHGHLSSGYQPPPSTPFFPPGTWEDPSRRPYAPPLFPPRGDEDQDRSSRSGGAGMSRGRAWGEEEASRPRSSGGGAVWVDRVRRVDGGSRPWDAGEQQKVEEARTGSGFGPPLVVSGGQWVPNSYRSVEGGQFGRDASRQFQHEPPLPPPLQPRSSAPGIELSGPPSSSSSHQTSSSSPTFPRDPSTTGSDVSLPSFRDFLLASTPLHLDEQSSSAHPSFRPSTYPPHIASPPQYEGPSLKRKHPSSSLSTAATELLQSVHRPPSGLLLPPPRSTSPSTSSTSSNPPHSFPPASYSSQFSSPHFKAPNPPPPPHHHKHHHHAPSPSLASSHSSFSRGEAHTMSSATPGRTPSPLEEETRLSEPRIVRPRGGMGSNGSHDNDEDDEEGGELSGESVGSEEKEKAVVKRVWEGIGMNGIER